MNETLPGYWDISADDPAEPMEGVEDWEGLDRFDNEGGISANLGPRPPAPDKGPVVLEEASGVCEEADGTEPKSD